MLALVFGLEKFRHYVYGRRISAVTDHKPLESIVKKSLAKAPKRLQSMLLRAQEYDFSLFYKPGNNIPVADALSRAPLQETGNNQFESVSNVSFFPISSANLNKLKNAVAKDQTFSLLKSTILSGWPSQMHELIPTLYPYFPYRDELTVQDGIIMRGERVLIP